MPVFMGLIGDLFPALDVPRKRDLDFEKKLFDGAVSMKLQPEPGFILKVKIKNRLNAKYFLMMIILSKLVYFRWYNW